MGSCDVCNGQSMFSVTYTHAVFLRCLRSSAVLLLRWAVVSVVGLHTPSPNDAATLPLEVWCQCCVPLEFWCQCCVLFCVVAYMYCDDGRTALRINSSQQVALDSTLFCAYTEDCSSSRSPHYCEEEESDRLHEGTWCSCTQIWTGGLTPRSGVRLVSLQCCFTSTETTSRIRDGEPRTATSTVTQLPGRFRSTKTVGLLGAGSPGRPPRLSHSS